MSGAGTLERARAAERAAEDELARIPEWLWDGRALPVPIDTIADTHYGLLVQEHDDLLELCGLPEGQVSGLLVAGKREIWLNADEARRWPARRRFTVGHELGHWVLHCERGRKAAEVVHCRDVTVTEDGAVAERDGANHLADLADYPPPELDANQFGAALLMPAARVREQRGRLGRDVDTLAAAFDVSGVAMERRLWYLDEAR